MVRNNLSRITVGVLDFIIDYPKSCLWMVAGALIGAGTGSLQGFLWWLGVFLAVAVFANHVEG